MKQKTKYKKIYYIGDIEQKLKELGIKNYEPCPKLEDVVLIALSQEKRYLIITENKNIALKIFEDIGIINKNIEIAYIDDKKIKKLSMCSEEITL